jgi:hypothetical protein
MAEEIEVIYEENGTFECMLIVTPNFLLEGFALKHNLRLNTPKRILNQTAYLLGCLEYLKFVCDHFEEVCQSEMRAKFEEIAGEKLTGRVQYDIAKFFHETCEKVKCSAEECTYYAIQLNISNECMDCFNFVEETIIAAEDVSRKFLDHVARIARELPKTKIDLSNYDEPEESCALCVGDLKSKKRVKACPTCHRDDICTDCDENLYKCPFCRTSFI